MRGFRLLRAVLAATLVICAGSARAEVKKFMTVCDGKLCPSYQLTLTLPDGWVLDEAATREYKAQIIIPKGKNFGNAPALMYVKIFFHPNKQQPLADFAHVSNERWRAAVQNAKISEIAAVERANGKQGFLRFTYENPSKQEQAHEVAAFGLDADKDGNEFVLMVVISGRAKKDLDGADKDYVAFLKAH